MRFVSCNNITIEEFSKLVYIRNGYPRNNSVYEFRGCILCDLSWHMRRCTFQPASKLSDLKLLFKFDDRNAVDYGTWISA